MDDLVAAIFVEEVAIAVTEEAAGPRARFQPGITAGRYPGGGISLRRMDAWWYGSPRCSAQNLGEIGTGQPCSQGHFIRLLVHALGVHVDLASRRPLCRSPRRRPARNHSCLRDSAFPVDAEGDSPDVATFLQQQRQGVSAVRRVGPVSAPTLWLASGCWPTGRRGCQSPRCAPYDHVTPPGAHWWNLWQLFVNGWASTGAVLNVPAMLIVAAITILLVIGIKESVNFNNVIVALKLAVILTFIAVGAAYINQHNWHPFVPPAISPGHFGWSGVVRAAGVIFFAYIGFDAVSTAAQEAKNPQRDMPIALLGSLAICTVLYIAVSLVLTGIVNYTQLNVSAPIAVAVSSLGPSLAWLEYFIKIGAIAGLSSVILVMLLGQPRIFYTMSKDGVLPPIFSAVHPKFRTPWIAQIITGVAAMLVSGLFPIGLLGELVSIGTLLAFAIVCAGIFVLRFTDPKIKRPFRTPIFWLIAPLGVLSCGYLMYGLPPTPGRGSSSG